MNAPNAKMKLLDVEQDAHADESHDYPEGLLVMEGEIL